MTYCCQLLRKIVLTVLPFLVLCFSSYTKCGLSFGWCELPWEDSDVFEAAYKQALNLSQRRWDWLKWVGILWKKKKTVFVDSPLLSKQMQSRAGVHVAFMLIAATCQHAYAQVMWKQAASRDFNGAKLRAREKIMLGCQLKRMLISKFSGSTIWYSIPSTNW